MPVCIHKILTLLFMINILASDKAQHTALTGQLTKKEGDVELRGIQPSFSMYTLD